jgi:hypothetical protein
VSHPSGSVRPDEIDAFLAATARERDPLVVGFRHQVVVLARVLSGLYDDLDHLASRLDDYAAKIGAAATTTTRGWDPADL